MAAKNAWHISGLILSLLLPAMAFAEDSERDRRIHEMVRHLNQQIFEEEAASPSLSSHTSEPSTLIKGSTPTGFFNAMLKTGVYLPPSLHHQGVAHHGDLGSLELIHPSLEQEGRDNRDPVGRF